VLPFHGQHAFALSTAMSNWSVAFSAAAAVRPSFVFIVLAQPSTAAAHSKVLQSSLVNLGVRHFLDHGGRAAICALILCRSGRPKQGSCHG
jgi:hypothetical protein